MTEIIIDTAEEEFLKGHTVTAFKWATIAQELDPNFGSVNQYVEGYRIHIAALKKHRTGEIDWYNLLGIQQDKCLSFSSQSITHKYVKLAKLINPDLHCSAAAPKAFKLVTTTWETLGEPDKRLAYHARVGLAPPKSEEQTTTRTRPSLKSEEQITTRTRPSLKSEEQITTRTRLIPKLNEQMHRATTRSRPNLKLNDEPPKKRCCVRSSDRHQIHRTTTRSSFVV
ncbi:hypothetical protein ACOSQ2_006645 [Xanthoceras sorbifolium]